MEILKPIRLLTAFLVISSVAQAVEEKKPSTPAPTAVAKTVPTSVPAPAIPAKHAAVTPAKAAAPGNLSISARLGAKDILLNGPDSRQQMVITSTAIDKSRPTLDVSPLAKYTASPAGIVTIDSHGFITPTANGKATITASHGKDKPASIQVAVNNFKNPPPISFPNDIVPIFTRNGCNAGACHAKSAGQNGFRLSLFGYDPDLDHESLINESRGRRIFPASQNTVYY